ncbi:MAG: GTP-binding protein [Synergistaceae bacterium]|nr:GTP-binding protein [Synergistaceae bacterium]
MPTGIYIVSGFLGAGKTTLIRKLLDEAFRDHKVAIVENDFGEANIDAALLGAGGVQVTDLQVTEINSGCICCSLSGDFVEALGETIESFKPDTVLIEPSGVAKLSDVLQGCLDPKIAPLAELRDNITVVDAGRCEMYLDNFGEFFEDQIRYADTVLLNRVSPADAARRRVRELNKNARILSQPWEQITAREILSPCRDAAKETAKETAKEIMQEIIQKTMAEISPQCCGHDHVHDHDHDHGHGDHSAEDFFDSVTLRPGRTFGEGELRACVSDMEKLWGGKVLRAKGILRGKDGCLNLQYLPGELTIEPSSVKPSAGDVICFIGHGIHRAELADIFCK